MGPCFDTLINWIGIIVGVVFIVFTFINIYYPAYYLNKALKNYEIDYNRKIEQLRVYIDNSLQDNRFYSNIQRFVTISRNRDFIIKKDFDLFFSMANCIINEKLKFNAIDMLNNLKNKKGLL